MQKNLILAVVLSVSIITLWDLLVLRPLSKPRSQVRQMTGEAPVLSPEPGHAVGPEEKLAPDSEEVSKEQTWILETEDARTAFSSWGGSVTSWGIKANGEWVEMLLKGGMTAHAMCTFDGVSFRGGPSGRGEMVLEGEHPSGIRIRKRFILGPRFLHRLELEFENTGSEPVDLVVPFGWAPGLGTDARAMADNTRDMRAVAYDGRRALSLSAGTHAGRFRWFGVDNRYFLAAFVPENQPESLLSVEAVRKQPPVMNENIPIRLRPGERSKRSYQFYLGPKSLPELKKPGFDLEAAVNFGTFGSLGRILFQILQWLDRVTGNYGWSIIFLTVALQILLLPLTMHSFRHSVRMKELQPQIQKLQAQFKGDPKRMNVELMNLYKKNGLKFMGMEGCFPMLLQLPFFWAFYTVLRNAYDLRGAPWVGWVKDLSVHDPYYILPVLMGVGMLVQQKSSGAVGGDPAQARMMMFMPLFFVFLFFKLPAGLVLYWFTNSLVSILVQRVMMWRHKEQHALAKV